MGALSEFKVAATAKEVCGVAMLGGPGVFSAPGSVQKVYDVASVVGNSTHVRVKANFHFIDNWFGESAFLAVKIGGEEHVVWQKSLDIAPRGDLSAAAAGAADVCGHVSGIG